MTVSGGTITSVTAMASGGPVEGRLRAGGTAWHSMWALETNFLNWSELLEGSASHQAVRAY